MSTKRVVETPPLREAFGQFLRLLRMIRPYWWALAKGLAFGLVLGMIGMVTPYVMKLLIDEVYPAGNVTLMHVLVGGVLAVAIASTVMGAIRSYYSVFVSAHLSTATSLMFFNHLQHLTVRFFDTHRVGEIMSRFGDVGSSLNAVSKVFQTVFVNGVYLVLVPPFLFFLQWKLAVVALIGIPLTSAITVASGRVLRKYWKRSAEVSAELGAFQVEVLSQIRTFKSSALERHVYRRARAQTETALEVRLKASGFAQLFGAANGLIRALNTAVFTWFGWTLILTQEMTLGAYIAFSAYIGYLYGPVVQFISLFSEFQQTAVNLGRMFEYLDSPTEQDPSLAYVPAEPIHQPLEGSIQLRDVSFAYQSHQPVLRELSVNFQPGTITAVVGPSGAGKSTVLRLITRMEVPDSGSICVDGTPMAEISLPDLRRQMSVVWQDFGMVKGTIWDNLTLGDGSVPRSVVLDAVRVCRLESLVEDLPQGLDSSVAEWGATLSGGQRQRMAIARALVRDTPILLLDEATSNIDLRTEAQILRDLFPRLRGKTVLFVTHRTATARLADRICVIDGGRVTGTGTHPELARNCEAYRAMLVTAADDDPPQVRVLPQRR